jgi:hypothetical protein
VKKTSELIAQARQNLLDEHSPHGIHYRVAMEQRRPLFGALVERLELILENDPPDGWFPLGSHNGFEGQLEFSEEVGSDGLPRWERHLSASSTPKDAE